MKDILDCLTNIEYEENSINAPDDMCAKNYDIGWNECEKMFLKLSETENMTDYFKALRKKRDIYG